MSDDKEQHIPTEEDTPSNETNALQSKVDGITKQLSKIQLIRNLFGGKEEKSLDDFKFWNTQPVVKPGDKNGSYGPIEADTPHEEIQKDPYSLPDDFEWCIMDVISEEGCKEVYTLLCENYVEDSEAMFRFDYSADFLRWALMPPGWKSEWHIGVRVKSNKKLVAFISGIPSTIKVAKKSQNLVEINFLCVHKKLRSKRLAPVLIKEVTRRVNLEGIFQALYTAGVYLPTPFTTCRYQHRPLNPKKLVDVGFSSLPRNLTMARQIRLLKVPNEPTLNLRPLREEDIPRVTTLLNDYNRKSTVTQLFTEEEAKYWLMPVKNVIYSYVAEDPGSKKITDFISFYSLPSSIIGNAKYSHINAAYLFYYFPKGLGSVTERIITLLRDALTMAKIEGFDVFNCLDMAQNGVFLEDLKFGKGDGNLNYYFYNYRSPTIDHTKMNLVLL